METEPRVDGVSVDAQRHCSDRQRAITDATVAAPAFPCDGNSNSTLRYSTLEVQNLSLVFAFTSERTLMDSNHEYRRLCMTLVS